MPPIGDSVNMRIGALSNPSSALSGLMKGAAGVEVTSLTPAGIEMPVSAAPTGLDQINSRHFVEIATVPGVDDEAIVDSNTETVRGALTSIGMADALASETPESINAPGFMERVEARALEAGERVNPSASEGLKNMKGSGLMNKLTLGMISLLTMSGCTGTGPTDESITMLFKHTYYDHPVLSLIMTAVIGSYLIPRTLAVLPRRLARVQAPIRMGAVITTLTLASTFAVTGAVNLAAGLLTGGVFHLPYLVSGAIVLGYGAFAYGMNKKLEKDAEKKTIQERMPWTNPRNSFNGEIGKVGTGFLTGLLIKKPAEIIDGLLTFSDPSKDKASMSRNAMLSQFIHLVLAFEIVKGIFNTHILEDIPLGNLIASMTAGIVFAGCMFNRLYTGFFYGVDSAYANRVNYEQFLSTREERMRAMGLDDSDPDGLTFLPDGESVMDILFKICAYEEGGTDKDTRELLTGITARLGADISATDETYGMLGRGVWSAFMKKGRSRGVMVNIGRPVGTPEYFAELINYRHILEQVNNWSQRNKRKFETSRRDFESLETLIEETIREFRDQERIWEWIEHDRTNTAKYSALDGKVRRQWQLQREEMEALRDKVKQWRSEGNEERMNKVFDYLIHTFDFDAQLALPYEWHRVSLTTYDRIVDRAMQAVKNKKDLTLECGDEYVERTLLLDEVIKAINEELEASDIAHVRNQGGRALEALKREAIAEGWTIEDLIRKASFEMSLQAPVQDGAKNGAESQAHDRFTEGKSYVIVEGSRLKRFSSNASVMGHIRKGGKDAVSDYDQVEKALRDAFPEDFDLSTKVGRSNVEEFTDIAIDIVMGLIVKEVEQKNIPEEKEVREKLGKFAQKYIRDGKTFDDLLKGVATEASGVFMSKPVEISLDQWMGMSDGFLLSGEKARQITYLQAARAEIERGKRDISGTLSGKDEAKVILNMAIKHSNITGWASIFSDIKDAMPASRELYRPLTEDVLRGAKAAARTVISPEYECVLDVVGERYLGKGELTLKDYIEEVAYRISLLEIDDIYVERKIRSMSRMAKDFVIRGKTGDELLSQALLIASSNKDIEYFPWATRASKYQTLIVEHMDKDYIWFSRNPKTGEPDDMTQDGVPYLLRMLLNGKGNLSQLQYSQESAGYYKVLGEAKAGVDYPEGHHFKEGEVYIFHDLSRRSIIMYRGKPHLYSFDARDPIPKGQNADQFPWYGGFGFELEEHTQRMLDRAFHEGSTIRTVDGMITVVCRDGKLIDLYEGLYSGKKTADLEAQVRKEMGGKVGRTLTKELGEEVLERIKLAMPRALIGMGIMTGREKAGGASFCCGTPRTILQAILRLQSLNQFSHDGNGQMIGYSKIQYDPVSGQYYIERYDPRWFERTSKRQLAYQVYDRKKLSDAEKKKIAGNLTVSYPGASIEFEDDTTVIVKDAGGKTIKRFFWYHQDRSRYNGDIFHPKDRRESFVGLGFVMEDLSGGHTIKHYSPDILKRRNNNNDVNTADFYLNPPEQHYHKMRLTEELNTYECNVKAEQKDKLISDIRTIAKADIEETLVGEGIYHLNITVHVPIVEEYYVSTGGREDKMECDLPEIMPYFTVTEDMDSTMQGHHRGIEIAICNKVEGLGEGPLNTPSLTVIQQPRWTVGGLHVYLLNFAYMLSHPSLLFSAKGWRNIGSGLWYPTAVMDRMLQLLALTFLSMSVVMSFGLVVMASSMSWPFILALSLIMAMLVYLPVLVNGNLMKREWRLDAEDLKQRSLLGKMWHAVSPRQAARKLRDSALVSKEGMNRLNHPTYRLSSSKGWGMGNVEWLTTERGEGGREELSLDTLTGRRFRPMKLLRSTIYGPGSFRERMFTLMHDTLWRGGLRLDVNYNNIILWSGLGMMGVNLVTTGNPFFELGGPILAGFSLMNNWLIKRGVISLNGEFKDTPLGPTYADGDLYLRSDAKIDKKMEEISETRDMIKWLRDSIIDGKGDDTTRVFVEEIVPATQTKIQMPHSRIVANPMEELFKIQERWRDILEMNIPKDTSDTEKQAIKSFMSEIKKQIDEIEKLRGRAYTLTKSNLENELKAMVDNENQLRAQNRATVGLILRMLVRKDERLHEEVKGLRDAMKEKAEDYAENKAMWQKLHMHLYVHGREVSKLEVAKGIIMLKGKPIIAKMKILVEEARRIAARVGGLVR